MNPQETAPAATPYRYEYAEEARKLALMRLSDEELAQHFEVSPETFRDWLASEPELARAVRRGRKLGDAEVVDAFHRNATGYSHEAMKVLKPAGQDEPVTVPYTKHYPPNAAAGKFWLCNRLPQQWSMKVQIEVRPRPENVGALERDDLDRLIAELAHARGFVPENPPAGWPRGVPAAAQ
jgi:hypothetical protein